MDNEDFLKVISKVPYGKVFDDPDNRSMIYREYLKVDTIDLDESLQKYFQIILTDEERRAANEGNKERLYQLAKDFQAFDPIPEKYQVKDIRETPLYKKLSEIKDAVEKMGSKKVTENKFFDKDAHFARVGDMMEELPGAIARGVIEVIEDTRADEWFSRKAVKKWGDEYNRDDGIELLKSLANYLKTRVRDTSSVFPNIEKKLSKWIEGATGKTLEEIIINKRLPDGVKRPKWIGKNKADAILFCNKTKVKVSEWNKCFFFADGKKLKCGNKSNAQYKTYEINDILDELMK